jgi:predicted membrane-bound dolichyl-phosphate-mannose-protein mannosyltransferase
MTPMFPYVLFGVVLCIAFVVLDRMRVNAESAATSFAARVVVSGAFMFGQVTMVVAMVLWLAGIGSMLFV